MKTVLFIPGFQEDLLSRDYKSAITAIADKGYNVRFVPIQWKRTTPKDWLQEFEAKYNRHDPSQTILAGFSYGAFTAFMAATNRNPHELWLFSLSPYFSDDIPTLKKSWLNEIGKRRVEEFRQLHFDALAKAIRCKALLFVGDQEFPEVKARASKAHHLLTNCTLLSAHGAGHDVSHPAYIAAISSAI